VSNPPQCIPGDPSGTVTPPGLGLSGKPRAVILLTATELGHGFGARNLFEDVSFTLSAGDRVGLIGPNGAGKSTLLRILSGQLSPDSGRVSRRNGLRVAYLAQVPEFQPGATVCDTILEGIPARDRGDWQAMARVEEMVSRLQLSGPAIGTDTLVDQLSGGGKRRVALARELVGEPDVLLLDEPTNHLDVEGILFLERLLAESPFATLTITHDRAFLQKVANRILELDRRNEGGLMDIAGDYATFVTRKADAMAGQEAREETMRNKLRRETEWLRRGPAARTTKQEARIKRAGELLEDVNELKARNEVRSVTLGFESEGRRPRRIIEAKGIRKAFGERVLFQNLDIFIGPGTRIGLLGPNGCGKSTLLQILCGQLKPDRGEVLQADGLQLAFFDQNRDTLDLNKTLMDTVCPDGDFVDYRGARMHRRGYLERFLFRPEQMDVRVGKLSGGEQSRLVMACLMLKPAHVLVLDEPTNDLDMQTLELLEEALVGFDGAVLLVSHDRFFLDQVTTGLLAFHTHPEELGQTTAFVGIAQWQEWHRGQMAGKPKGQTNKDGGAKKIDARPRKLSFKDQREYDGMEERILQSEAQKAAFEAELAKPEVASNSTRLCEVQLQLAKADEAVSALYARWAELEALKAPLP
jgi:ABC transport system ATP-binding/permease protein